jgi:hypothetical protein
MLFKLRLAISLSKPSSGEVAFKLAKRRGGIPAAAAETFKVVDS